MLVAAHRALGTTLFYLGAVAAAHTHFAQGIALYDPSSTAPRRSSMGRTLAWFATALPPGRCGIWAILTRGWRRASEAVTLAQQIAHPFSLGFALSCAAMFHQFRREVRAAQERAEAAISLATEQGFPHWMAMGAILHGWALAHQGQAQEGIEQITRA